MLHDAEFSNFLGGIFTPALIRGTSFSEKNYVIVQISSVKFRSSIDEKGPLYLYQFRKKVAAIDGTQVPQTIS